MKTYAIIRNNLVWNTIIAVDIDAVKFLMQGLGQGFDEIVEMTDETKAAAPNYEYVDGKFRRPKPSNAYVWNESIWDWSPKEPKPEGNYYWNIETETWQELVFDVE